jgi:hypothetical protein
MSYRLKEGSLVLSFPLVGNRSFAICREQNKKDFEQVGMTDRGPEIDHV